MTVKTRVFIYFLFLLLAKQVFGADQFKTDYSVHYIVNETGETSVNQHIKITNLISDVVATKYVVKISNINMYDEKAYEEQDEVNLIKEYENDLIKLTVNFEKYTVGKDKSKEILISYKTKDISTKNGRVWSVNIPKAQIPQLIDSYTVKLTVPEKWGEEMYMSPLPAHYENFTYTFSNDQLKNTGITSAFGEFQVLNFKLTYEIKNPWFTTSIFDIALPPDIIGVQQISFTDLKPYPNKIFLDLDGNTVARYKLAQKQQLNVVFLGKAKILSRQIDVLKGGSKNKIPNQIANAYTSKNKYWESDNKIIKTLSQQLYDNKLNVSQNSKKMYDYIVSNFLYDTNISGTNGWQRQGALFAIQNKKNVACMEFTDSFVALTRASGIPSREINGYAFSTNEKAQPLSVSMALGDLLHSWAEYYDPNFGWVQIDPTWANTSGIDYFTKLDTNHFALVIRGKSSVRPLPAGAYRISSDKKLLEIDFDKEENSQGAFEEKLTFESIPTTNIFRKIFGQKRYLVSNAGSVLIYDINQKLYLVPKQSKEIYISKKADGISYKTFDGKSKFLNLN